VSKLFSVPNLWKKKAIYKLLIVDDEVEFCRPLQEHMETVEGFETQVCNDSTQAMEMARSFMPDVILLDIVMPNLSGSDLANQLKQNPATQKIPVIFLTALVTRKEFEEREQIGGQQFLTKPVRVGELMQAIETALQQNRKNHADE